MFTIPSPRWEVRYLENGSWRVAGRGCSKQEARIIRDSFRDSWYIRSGGRGRLQIQIVDLFSVQ